MSASMKMLQTCRSCLKCFNSTQCVSERIPRHIQRNAQIRKNFSSSRLLSRKDGSDSDGNDAKNEESEKKLEAVAKVLSDKIPGEKGKGIKLDLISKLRNINRTDTEEDKTGELNNIGNVLKKMTVEVNEEAPTSGSWRNQLSKLKNRQVGKDVQPETYQQLIKSYNRTNLVGSKYYKIQSLDKNFKLFDGPRLDIFDPEIMKTTDSQSQTKETLWDVVEKENREFLESFPKNGFEEMIMLTKQGKLWKFPIDNEQDWEIEQKTGFHEHVFLDHLIQDFPKKGPLRHFMDIVVIALSKNPFLTAQQKREHVQWFREYFTEKRDILVETLGENGVIGDQETPALEEGNEKQNIENY